MKQETIYKKALKVLENNKYIQEQLDEESTLKDLLFQWSDGTVVLSNESSIYITNDGYLELLFGLTEEFEKAGLFVEPYDAGTFIITKGD